MRHLLDRPEPLVVPECYSALTARIAEQAGFEAVYCGSNGAGAMHLGIPDHGLATTVELIEIAARIVSCINIPLICDADQGGEQPLNVARTVRGFERAGVAAIHIEDTVNPKGSVTGEASLQPVAAMCARIAAAVEARDDESFLIIARSDGLATGLELDDVIARGNAYADAGADVFWCLGMRAESIARVAAQVPIPLMDVDHPEPVARRRGLAIALFAGHAVSAAARLHRDMMRELRETGRIEVGAERELTKSEYLALADWDGYGELATSRATTEISLPS